MKPLSEEEEKRRGQMVVDLLGLKAAGKFDGSGEAFYNTEVGTKTALGLFRTLERIIKDGE